MLEVDLIVIGARSFSTGIVMLHLRTVNTRHHHSRVIEPIWKQNFFIDELQTTPNGGQEEEMRKSCLKMVNEPRNGLGMIHTITSQHFSSFCTTAKKILFNSFSCAIPLAYKMLRRPRISLHGVRESTGRRATFKFQLSSQQSRRNSPWSEEENEQRFKLKISWMISDPGFRTSQSILNKLETSVASIKKNVSSAFR